MEHFDREETPVESELHQQPRCGMMPNAKGATDANEGCGDASEGCTDTLDGIAATRTDDTQLLRHIRVLLGKQRDEVLLHVDRCFKHQGQVVETLLLQRSSGKHSAKASRQGFDQPSSILRQNAIAEEFEGIKGSERDARFADDLESVEVYQDITRKELNDMLGRFSAISADESAPLEAIVKRATIDSDDVVGYDASRRPSEWNRDCSATQSSIFGAQSETRASPSEVMRGSMQSLKGIDSIKEARSIRTTQRRISDIDLQLKEAAAKQDEPPPPVIEVKEEPSLRERMWLSFRKIVQAFVRHTAFETFTFVIIFTNVAIVGIEVDYMAASHDPHTPNSFYTIDCVYTLLFLFELLCRMIAEEPNFFYSRNWAWNYFDLVIVASSVMETTFTMLESSGGIDMSHFRVIRVIRITRLIRTFRMVRLVRFIRALRTLLYSIMVTMKSLVWALLLLLMIFYGFGVAFTQAVSEYNIGVENIPAFGESNCGPDTVFCSLLTFWGTLPRAMFTLFKAIAGGVSWHSVVEPLGLIGWVWVGVFVGFIAFTFLAVLNVVTGVFCQSAIESAQQDKDIATMQLMASRGAFIDTIKKLFIDIDVDLSGAISIREFEDFLQNDRFQAYFATLEIDASDIWSLFKLMDSDQTGNIDLEEFIGGCLQLRGQAKAIQIAKMSYDNSLVRKMLVEFMDSVDDRLDRLLLWAGIDLYPEDEEEEGVHDVQRNSDCTEPESSHNMQGSITTADGMYSSHKTEASGAAMMKQPSQKSVKSDRTHVQLKEAQARGGYRRAMSRCPSMMSRQSKASAAPVAKRDSARGSYNSYRTSATSARSSQSHNSGLFIKYAKVSNEEDRQALARLDSDDFSRLVTPSIAGLQEPRDITL